MHLTMEKMAVIHIKKSTSANMKTTIIGSNTENGKKKYASTYRQFRKEYIMLWADTQNLPYLILQNKTTTL
jgi:hypothetical protein